MWILLAQLYLCSVVPPSFQICWSLPQVWINSSIFSPFSAFSPPPPCALHPLLPCSVLGLCDFLLSSELSPCLSLVPSFSVIWISLLKCSWIVHFVACHFLSTWQTLHQLGRDMYLLFRKCCPLGGKGLASWQCQNEDISLSMILGSCLTFSLALPLHRAADHQQHGPLEAETGLTVTDVFAISSLCEWSKGRWKPQNETFLDTTVQEPSLECTQSWCWII